MGSIKIARNIIPGCKLFAAVRHLNKYKKQIDAAAATGDLEAEKDGIQKALYNWSHKLADQFNVEVRIHGEENIPVSGPVVFVANHQSYADIPVTAYALNTVPFGFVAKGELEKVPVYGPWMARIRSVFLKRDDPREALRTINAAIDNIEQGFSMMIFPEGKRSWGGKMIKFKPGSFRLAFKPEVPIIPVTIDRTFLLFESHGYFKGNGYCDITVHPAVPTAGLSKAEQTAVVDSVFETVMSALPPERQQVMTDEEYELMKKEGRHFVPLDSDK